MFQGTGSATPKARLAAYLQSRPTLKRVVHRKVGVKLLVVRSLGVYSVLDTAQNNSQRASCKTTYTMHSAKIMHRKNPPSLIRRHHSIIMHAPLLSSYIATPTTITPHNRIDTSAPFQIQPCAHSFLLLRSAKSAKRPTHKWSAGLSSNSPDVHSRFLPVSLAQVEPAVSSGLDGYQACGTYLRTVLCE